jgi:hypothetical protein
MLVGVVSDTHGNREGMLLLVQRLRFLGSKLCCIWGMTTGTLPPWPRRA